MSEWGRRTYGDPCRECGFEWSISEEDAVAVVRGMPALYRRALRGADPSAHLPELSWSVGAYVCHVGDNLRIAAERYVAAARGGPTQVAPYDPDLLAQARVYERVPIEGALWSLERAVRDWEDARGEASRAAVGFSHPDRGPQTVADVSLNNAHDCFHHRWDIERILGSAAR